MTLNALGPPEGAKTITKQRENVKNHKNEDLRKLRKCTFFVKYLIKPIEMGHSDFGDGTRTIKKRPKPYN